MNVVWQEYGFWEIGNFWLECTGRRGQDPLGVKKLPTKSSTPVACRTRARRAQDKQAAETKNKVWSGFSLTSSFVLVNNKYGCHWQWQELVSVGHLYLESNSKSCSALPRIKTCGLAIDIGKTFTCQPYATTWLLLRACNASLDSGFWKGSCRRISSFSAISFTADVVKYGSNLLERFVSERHWDAWLLSCRRTVMSRESKLQL